MFNIWFRLWWTLHTSSTPNFTGAVTFPLNANGKKSVNVHENGKEKSNQNLGKEKKNIEICLFENPITRFTIFNGHNENRVIALRIIHVSMTITTVLNKLKPYFLWATWKSTKKNLRSKGFGRNCWKICDIFNAFGVDNCFKHKKGD